MKAYIRFSTPGGQGYIAGTSADKFRQDWINLLSFSFPDAPGGSAVIPSSPALPALYLSLRLVKAVDRASETLYARATNGQWTDKVVLEQLTDDGALFFQVEFRHVNVDNVQWSPRDVPELEAVTLSTESGAVTYQKGGAQVSAGWNVSAPPRH